MEFLPFTRPTLDEETISAVAKVLRSGWLTTGEYVVAFEAALSDFCGGRPVRVASSATASLEMALKLAGIGVGDEVITTPLSWVATANVILAVGATPVFVDVDSQTRNLDLRLVERAITPRTRALLPVDLAGLAVKRATLYDIAQRHYLRVIEDAAQSIGAQCDGQRIGVSGDLVSFSFHANKNMTTGEGGALVMNDANEARLFEKLRLQGVSRFADGTMDVDILGGKANLTEFAAVIGLRQLKQLESFNRRRAQLAAQYFAHFDPSLACDLPPNDSSQTNWHMFQILLPLKRMRIDRKMFIDAMKAAGIGVGVHYPAIHLFTLFRQRGFKPGDFPVAEEIAQRTVTLPLFPAMSDGDVKRVCDAVSDILKPVLYEFA